MDILDLRRTQLTQLRGALQTLLIQAEETPCAQLVSRDGFFMFCWPRQIQDMRPSLHGVIAIAEKTPGVQLVSHDGYLLVVYPRRVSSLITKPGLLD